MLPSWLSTLASIGMAVGPPLVYADQTVSIVRKKCVFFFLLACHHENNRSIPYGKWLLNRDSTGFSRDVCAILWACHYFLRRVWVLTCYRLLANITRCFFWLGERFEIALLIQSLLMIMAQVSSKSEIHIDWINVYPACTTLHLHLPSTKIEPGEYRWFSSAILFLAVANILAAYRISCCIHVRYPFIAARSLLELATDYLKRSSFLYLDVQKYLFRH